MRSRTHSFPCFASFSPPVARFPSRARAVARARRWAWSSTCSLWSPTAGSLAEAATGVRFGPPRARHVAERRSADGDEVDGEDQGVARGGPLVAVREVREDGEGAAAADVRAVEPPAPATDALVQGEADRAAPVPRRVEHLTRGRRGTDVVDGHRVALGHGGAGALDVVDDLQLVDGSGGL